jgi:formylglycine-generating enzyme required for sulfatase activity
MNLRQVAFAIVMPIMWICVGIQSHGQDREVLVPRVMVKVRISNPDQFPMTLYREESGVPVEDLRLHGTKEESFSVESGVYWLSQTDRPQNGWPFQLPVPAIATALKEAQRNNVRPPELLVEIGKPQEPRTGLSWISAGPALIGDQLGVGQPDERPARIVEVPGFWIGQREVTNEEYAEFLNAVEKNGATWIDLDNQMCLIRKQHDKFVATQERFPVVTVTYAGAVAFCEWRTKVTGQKHRLPSEAEWEKAARGPQSYTYSYGNTYEPTAANQESGRIARVGRFGFNGFGTMDMTGNVFEWVAATNAAEGKEGNAKIYSHPLRGGSFVLDGMYLRNSFRMRQSPEVMADDIGFRVAVDAEPKKVDTKEER